MSVERYNWGKRKKGNGPLVQISLVINNGARTGELVEVEDGPTTSSRTIESSEHEIPLSSSERQQAARDALLGAERAKPTSTSEDLVKRLFRTFGEGLKRRNYEEDFHNRFDNSLAPRQFEQFVETFDAMTNDRMPISEVKRIALWTTQQSESGVLEEERESWVSDGIDGLVGVAISLGYDVYEKPKNPKQPGDPMQPFILGRMQSLISSGPTAA